VSQEEGGDVSMEIERDEEEFLAEIAEFDKDKVIMVLDYFSGPFFVDSRGNQVETLSICVKRRLLTVLNRIMLRLIALSYGVPDCTDKDLLNEKIKLLAILRQKVMGIADMLLIYS